MKVAAINTVPFGSTGNIMLQIAETGRSLGVETRTFTRGWKGQPPASESRGYIGTYLENGLHHVLTDCTGLHGMFSFFGTGGLIRQLEEWEPDLIHLHNLHPSYLNLPMLFSYIRKHRIRVVWTLHDCWAFTGQCPHFTYVQCDKWKTGCHDCPQFRNYPESHVDQTRLMWRLKKKWFTGVEDLVIVTPSRWLGDMVQQSFLGAYPVRVINNGVDLSLFRPTPSDIRQRAGLQSKKLILGVAQGWGERKGLEIFVRMSRDLPEDFRIVLVGTDGSLELPENILSVRRTRDRRELAQYYTAADVFANPTLEDNFPTVNLEAMACGTPVVTFRTGGSPEMLDERCDIVVDYNDYDAFLAAVRKVCASPQYREHRMEHLAEEYDSREKFLQYIRLYRSMMDGRNF